MHSTLEMMVDTMDDDTDRTNGTGKRISAPSAPAQPIFAPISTQPISTQPISTQPISTRPAFARLNLVRPTSSSKTFALLACVLMLVIISAGCLKPVDKLGCCLKENATSTNPADFGCVLYNMTDFTTRDMKAATHSCNDAGLNTTGFCNVTTNVDSRGVEETHLIPICTQDNKNPCVNGDCTGMLCGNYKFKPRAAPAFTTTEDMEGEIPPAADEETVIQFYKAQCRFLAVDKRFDMVMRNSESKLNVFRIGIGNSFNEFEQYRNLFPLSDRFCSISPNNLGPKIDRYMNYIAPSGTGVRSVNPDALFRSNCITSQPAGAPMKFTESPTPFTYNDPREGGVDVTPANPDSANYKMAQHVSFYGTLTRYSAGSATYATGFTTSKKLDVEFYKKSLYTAYYGQMDGRTTETGVRNTRAPFECELDSECYSGACDKTNYNRGVMLQDTSRMVGSLAGIRETFADCFQTIDIRGRKVVVCAPTTMIGGMGTAESTQTVLGSAAPVNFFETPIASVNAGGVRAASNINPRCRYENGRTYLCGPYFNFINPTGSTPVATTRSGTSERMPFPSGSEDAASEQAVPAGGALFFGKVMAGRTALPVMANLLENRMPADDPQPTFTRNPELNEPHTIIGYALADSLTSFRNTALAARCGLQEAYDYAAFSTTETGTCMSGHSCLGHSAYDALGLYINDSMTALAQSQGDNCREQTMDLIDIELSATPWVLSYKKKRNTYLSSPIAQALRSRNMLDQTMPKAFGTDPCTLKSTKTSSYTGWSAPDGSVISSPSIILLFYHPGSGHIGTAPGCEIDEETYLPKIRTFGWCQSCSSSTLASQRITTQTNPYIPKADVKVYSDGTVKIEDQCSTDRDASSLTSLKCTNTKIPDIQDFSGDMAVTGIPRTIPQAATLKGQIGTYLQQGVMPVLDISDATNWNVNRPGGGLYRYYDFERLFGNMGATIVIVSHVSSSSDAGARLREIVDRTSIVRQKCAGCLSAIHVDAPASSDEFVRTINTYLSDPRANYGVDMVTFDYHLPLHASVTAGVSDPKQKAYLIVTDMASYGQKSLQTKRKPTMIVGFSAPTNQDGWTDATYKDLFETILTNRPLLVNSGVIGLIYAPARDQSSLSYGGISLASEGLVSIDPRGSGVFGAKMCAMELAIQSMTTTPPLANFARLDAVNDTNCITCTSFEMSHGLCSRQCDNGRICTLPSGLASGQARCPSNTIIDSEVVRHTEPTIVDRSRPITVCNERGCAEVLRISPQPGITRTIHCQVTGDSLGERLRGIALRYTCTSRTTGGPTAPTLSTNRDSALDHTGLTQQTYMSECHSDGDARVCTVTTWWTGGDLGSAPPPSRMYFMEMHEGSIIRGTETAVDSGISYMFPQEGYESLTTIDCTDDGSGTRRCTTVDSSPTPTTRPSGPTDERCTLCSQMSGSYICSYRYFNGTTEVKSGSMSRLTSDLYSDIIGALPRPSKCCLENSEGNRYTYTKRALSVATDRPIIYPRTGTPGADCGISGNEELRALGIFCGVNVPIKNYDINCTINTDGIMIAPGLRG